VLGDCDSLEPTGGRGENLPVVRDRIRALLEYLGVEPVHELNAAHVAPISRPKTDVRVCVIRTDEGLMVTNPIIRILGIDLHGIHSTCIPTP
jgi:acetate kinase